MTATNHDHDLKPYTLRGHMVQTDPTAQCTAKCTVSSLQLNSFDIVGQISPSYVFGRQLSWPSWLWPKGKGRGSERG